MWMDGGCPRSWVFSPSWPTSFPPLSPSFPFLLIFVGIYNVKGVVQTVRGPEWGVYGLEMNRTVSQGRKGWAAGECSLGSVGIHRKENFHLEKSRGGFLAGTTCIQHVGFRWAGTWGGGCEGGGWTWWAFPGENTAEAEVCRPHSLEWTQEMTAIHVAGEDSKEVG